MLSYLQRVTFLVWVHLINSIFRFSRWKSTVSLSICVSLPLCAVHHGESARGDRMNREGIYGVEYDSVFCQTLFVALELIQERIIRCRKGHNYSHTWRVCAIDHPKGPIQEKAEDKRSQCKRCPAFSYSLWSGRRYIFMYLLFFLFFSGVGRMSLCQDQFRLG